MNEKYESYSMVQLFAAIGDKHKAVEIYLELHPEEEVEEVRGDFDFIEEYSKRSVFEILSAGKFCGDYDSEDAIAEYLEMHPDANEADVRAELEKEMADPDND